MPGGASPTPRRLLRAGPEPPRPPAPGPTAQVVAGHGFRRYLTRVTRPPYGISINPYAARTMALTARMVQPTLADALRWAVAAPGWGRTPVARVRLHSFSR
jgi:hypothetical protein